MIDSIQKCTLNSFSDWNEKFQMIDTNAPFQWETVQMSSTNFDVVNNLSSVESTVMIRVDGQLSSLCAKWSIQIGKDRSAIASIDLKLHLSPFPNLHCYIAIESRMNWAKSNELSEIPAIIKQWLALLMLYLRHRQSIRITTRSFALNCSHSFDLKLLEVTKSSTIHMLYNHNTLKYWRFVT